jgi:hypothetical protein
MFPPVFSDYSRLAFHVLPKECTMNNDDFCDVFHQEARTAVRSITDKTEIEETMIHLDDCRAHNFQKTARKLEDFRVARPLHVLYSAGISPCDFWFLGWSKNTMLGQGFSALEGV